VLYLGQKGETSDRDCTTKYKELENEGRGGTEKIAVFIFKEGLVRRGRVKGRGGGTRNPLMNTKGRREKTKRK